jgi:hypothetical protein
MLKVPLLVALILIVECAISIVFIIGCAIPIQIPTESVEVKRVWRSLSGYTGFMIYWNSYFLLSSMIYIICHSVCDWYFRDSNSRKDIKIMNAVRAFFTHIGSIAFGSLIISIFAFIRALIEAAKS